MYNECNDIKKINIKSKNIKFLIIFYIECFDRLFRFVDTSNKQSLSL